MRVAAAKSCCLTFLFNSSHHDTKKDAEILERVQQRATKMEAKSYDERACLV